MQGSQADHELIRSGDSSILMPSNLVMSQRGDGKCSAFASNVTVAQLASAAT
jgi:hypothetical protein